MPNENAIREKIMDRRAYESSLPDQTRPDSTKIAQLKAAEQRQSQASRNNGFFAAISQFLHPAPGKRRGSGPDMT